MELGVFPTLIILDSLMLVHPPPPPNDLTFLQLLYPYKFVVGQNAQRVKGFLEL